MAQVHNGKIVIRGNQYEDVVLAHAPFMQLASAQRLQQLTGQGGRLLVVGPRPDRQPSFLNYEQNDQLTWQCLAVAMQAPTSTALASASGATPWARALKIRVAFVGIYSFVRQMQREMTDGSRLHFLWNQSAHSGKPSSCASTAPIIMPTG